MIKTCSNCGIYGCGRFDAGNYCDWWKDKFSVGQVVEIEHDDFKFSFKGEMTDIYVTGRIVKSSENNVHVKLYCNGKVYEVERKWLKLA